MEAKERGGGGQRNERKEVSESEGGREKNRKQALETEATIVHVLSSRVCGNKEMINREHTAVMKE